MHILAALNIGVAYAFSGLLLFIFCLVSFPFFIFFCEHLWFYLVIIAFHQAQNTVPSYPWLLITHKINGGRDLTNPCGFYNLHLVVGLPWKPSGIRTQPNVATFSGYCILPLFYHFYLVFIICDIYVYMLAFFLKILCNSVHVCLLILLTNSFILVADIIWTL